MPRLHSDHAPIILNTTKPMPKPKHFQIEHWWLSNTSFKGICERSWATGTDLTWGQRYSNLVTGLKAWRRKITTPVQRQREIQDQLHEIQHIHPAIRDYNREAHLMTEYDKVMKDLEVMWHQRARVRWASLGDRNTKFFHSMATIRRRQNRIETLQQEDGSWTSTEQQTRKILINYYKDLYRTSLVRQQDGDNLFQEAASKFPRLDQQARNILGSIPTEKEVKEVLWGMGQDRAPGPDGLTVRFLKEMWECLRMDVVHTVQEAYKRGHMPKEWLEAYIVLIPKTDNPCKPDQFRPISVCSVLYRLTMKVITRRMALFMPSLISGAQTAFVKGRGFTRKCHYAAGGFKYV